MIPGQKEQLINVWQGSTRSLPITSRDPVQQR